MLASSFVGFFAAQTLSRWSVSYSTTETPAPALPAGFADIPSYNAAAVLARPTGQAQAWQWGFSLLTLLTGLAIKWRPGKLIAYGLSFGSALHAGAQIITGYIILPMVSGKSWGQRAYAVELQDNYMLGKMTAPTTSSTTQGLGQPPSRMGAPPIRALPAQQPIRVPTALASAPMMRAGVPFPHGTAAGSRLGQGAPPSPDFTGSGTTPPANTVPNLPNGNCPPGSIAVTNPANLDMPFCVNPNAPPPAPPTTAPPPPPTAGPPPPAPPPPMAPPPMAPPPMAPPPYAGPPPTGPYVPACPIPWQGAPQPCCGTSPCSCGVQNGAGVPATVLGQPQSGPAHPLFAMMLAPRTRAAA